PGVARVLVLAPEIEENRWLIAEAIVRGVTVSAGHTDATYDQALQAVEDGVRHVTHAFNAMRSLGHREPGLLGAALVLPELGREVIGGDAVRAPGRPDGAYTVGDRPAFAMDGSTRLGDGTLAGSVLTLDRALHNLQAATGRPLAELWPTASRNAAQAIGIDDAKGTLEPGKDAGVGRGGPALKVVVTVAEGAVVHGGDRLPRRPAPAGPAPPSSARTRSCTRRNRHG